MGQSHSQHEYKIKPHTSKEKQLLAKIHAMGLDKFAKRNPAMVAEQQHCLNTIKKCTKNVLSVNTFDDYIRYSTDCFGLDDRHEAEVKGLRHVVQQKGLRKAIQNDIHDYYKNETPQGCNQFTDKKIIEWYRGYRNSKKRLRI
jgi:hypothetical protein